MKINKARIGTLTLVLIVGMIHVPERAYGNFWNISYWEIFPFALMYGYFVFIYAFASKFAVERFIRLVKKYA